MLITPSSLCFPSFSILCSPNFCFAEHLTLLFTFAFRVLFVFVYYIEYSEIVKTETPKSSLSYDRGTLEMDVQSNQTTIIQMQPARQGQCSVSCFLNIPAVFNFRHHTSLCVASALRLLLKNSDAKKCRCLFW